MARIDACQLEGPSAAAVVCYGMCRWTASGAGTVPKASYSAWDDGRSTSSRAPRCQANHQSACPAWRVSKPSQPPFGAGQQTSPGFHCGRDSYNWRLLWICSPGTCKAVSFETAWTRSSAIRAWGVAAFPVSCTPIMTANPPRPTSRRGCNRKSSDQLVRHKAQLRQHPCRTPVATGHARGSALCAPY
jgi:hypothetical protein